MAIADVKALFGFFGGLGMFLYGMKLMAGGMQKSAGNKMNHLMGMLTNNRFLAIIVGALITSIIQSSGATTVMVVGFVNAGIMSLTQAVGVIMGANIGTTITSWIISISQFGEKMEVLKPGFYAPFLIGMAALLIMFSKKQLSNIIGEIVIGLGFLFMGLELMSSSLSVYAKSPLFVKAFELFGSNPFLGIAIGMLVTGLLQSSSVSVGILQTLALQGVVTFNAAVYISLGSNIGSCFTAMLSSIGAPKNAKRAAIIHLMFNIIGTVVFGGLMFIIFMINKELAAASVDSVKISVFHTIFNVANTLLLLPFANQLVKISKIIICEDESEKGEVIDFENVEQSLKRHLDKRLLETPGFAIENSVKEAVKMAYLTLENTKMATQSIIDLDGQSIKMIYENEKKINYMEKTLTEYLVKVSNLNLTERQHELLNHVFYTISDIERIGDHAENIAELAESLIKDEIAFSATAIEDIRQMNERVIECFETAIRARETENLGTAKRVIELEESVDLLENSLREKHITRLANNKCNASTGVVFLDAINNLERISDHAYNIANYVISEK